MKIGLIGLGRMGGGMARRLLTHGYDLGILRRDPHQSVVFEELGASVAANIGELCQGRDLVISMLPSDDSLEAVALRPGGLTECLAAGAIHMVSGTHGVGSVEKLMAAHHRQRQILVTCAVLGRPDRASAGTLALIPAGPAAAIATLRPVLNTLGQTIFDAGEDPLSGMALKIANNFVLGCAIEAIGEGMSLVRRYGVDPALFQAILTQGLFNCIAYQGYADVIAKQDWQRVGATASIGLKDARLALEAADKFQVPLPSAHVWQEHLLAACERGEAALDWSVMAREQFRRSGLE